MKILIAGFAALSVFAAAEARAQVLELTQTSQPIISVTGVGEASKAADYGMLRFSYRGEGKSQVDALRALTVLRARVEGGLNNLKGLAGIKIESGGLNVQEVWSKECNRDADTGYIGEDGPQLRAPHGACVVDGYVATSNVSAEVSPAEVSGNAASLAAELGGIGVSLLGGGVQDPAALDQSAEKAALENARAKAEAIAAASGLRLGLVMRIQDPQFGSDVRYKEYSDQSTKVQLVRAYAPVSPTVRLDLPPPPVKRQVQMSVIYAIER